MRVKESTLKLVRMYAGELQLASGDTISDNEAMLEMFRKHRPDLVSKLDQQKPTVSEQMSVFAEEPNKSR